MPFWQQQRFAEFLLQQFRGKKSTGWSDLVTRFWTETGGADWKSFLPPKKASKIWRGAGKKKGQKKKTQTVTVRHNLDLNRLSLQKALGFLAEFYKAEVQECIQKTARPPYWQITEPILEHIDLPTPSHRLLAPHMDDMFQALELMTGSRAKVELRWNLAHRLSVVVTMLKPVKWLDLDMRVVIEKQGRYPKRYFTYLYFV